VSNPLYIRVRGRVLGPYDPEKLQALAQQGQFSRMHEVSEDGVSWVKATNYPELFSARLNTAALKKPAAAPATTSASVATSTPANETRAATNSNHHQGDTWYYTSHGHEVGPVSMAELQQSARAGNITSADQVWAEGMPQWVPAGELLPLPPAASESVPTAMPVPPSSVESARAGEVPDDIVRSLSSSRPWILLVGIVMLIQSILFLVMAIFSLAASSRLSADEAESLINGVTHLIHSIAYGIAGSLLLVFAGRISAHSYQATFASLRQALDGARSFWIVFGIYMAIGLILLGVIMLYAFAILGRLS